MFQAKEKSMQEEEYKAEDFLREVNMIQRYDNGTGQCVSSFCDGEVDPKTRKPLHPCSAECWFERVSRFLKRSS